MTASGAEPVPFARRAGEGREFDLANGNVVEVKAGAADTGARVTLLEGRHVVGSGPPLHVHDEVDELFYVVEGRYAITMAGTVHDAEPGTLVYVPRGAPHRYEAVEEPARMLLVYVPGGFEGYFEERLAEERRTGAPLGPEALDAIGRRYGMRVVDE